MLTGNLVMTEQESFGQRLKRLRIVDLTCLCKTVVSRCIAEMAEDHIIIKNGKHLGFQKDWEQWPRKLAESSTNVSSTANKKDEERLAESSTAVSNSVNKSLQNCYPQKIKDTSTKDRDNHKKKTYGSMNNVSLTDNEVRKLRERFTDFEERLESFSLKKASHGYKFKSDYATILDWARQDEQEKGKFNNDDDW